MKELLEINWNFCHLQNGYGWEYSGRVVM